MRYLGPLLLPATLIGQFVAWWLDELWGIVPAALRRLFVPGQRSVSVRATASGARICRWDGPKRREAFEAASANLKAAVARQRRSGTEIVLCLPAERVLFKEISLPVLPPSELRRALYYQIDRQTPFAAADVHFDCEVIEASASQLRMRLAVVPRKIVDQEALRFTDQGIRFDRIAVGDEDDSRPPRLDLKVGFEEPVKGRSFADAVNALMAAAACALIVATGYLIVDERLAAADELGAQVAGARRAADEVATLEKEVGTLRKDLMFFADRKRRQPMTLSILVELTRILPDHTWLSELQFRGDEVRMAGFSAAAAELIALVDGSEMFFEPRFRSPVTQDTVTGKERFNMTFRISAPVAGKAQ